MVEHRFRLPCLFSQFPDLQFSIKVQQQKQTVSTAIECSALLVVRTQFFNFRWGLYRKSASPCWNAVCTRQAIWSDPTSQLLLAVLVVVETQLAVMVNGLGACHVKIKNNLDGKDNRSILTVCRVCVSVKNTLPRGPFYGNISPRFSFLWGITRNSSYFFWEQRGYVIFSLQKIEYWI